MDERNKFLTKAMGECWHESFIEDPTANWKRLLCTCGYLIVAGNSPRVPISKLTCPKENINFSTWREFGILWEWAQKQGWWDAFSDPAYGVAGFYDLSIVHPDRFADAVYEFLKDTIREE